MTQYRIMHPTRGEAGKVRWTHAVAEGELQTLCGKRLTVHWLEVARCRDGRAASNCVHCGLCAPIALRLHKEEIAKRPHTPAGTMYVSLKTRGV